jgi:predicted permease
MLMAAGFASAKLKVSGPEMASKVSVFLLNIALPALLFVSFQRPFSRQLLSEAGTAIAVSAGLYAVFFLIAFVYPRLLGIKGPERGVHRYAVLFSNCGFIGYPMVEAALGHSYIFHAVIFNIPFSLLAYSVGAWIISREGKGNMPLSWKVFVNPSIVATALGFICFMFSLSLPEPVFRAFKMTADTTSPLSMFVIGITLAQANAHQIFGRWRIYVTVAVRLVLLPFITVVFCYFFGIPGPVIILAMLLVAMPAASNTSLYASFFGVAPEEASSLVFLSTVLCVLTIPGALLIVSGLLGAP